MSKTIQTLKFTETTGYTVKPAKPFPNAPYELIKYCDGDFDIDRNEILTIDLNLIAEFNEGYALEIINVPKLTKNGILIQPSVIGHGNKDSIKLILHNLTLIRYKIRKGDYIAQCRLIKLETYNVE